MLLVGSADFEDFCGSVEGNGELCPGLEMINEDGLKPLTNVHHTSLPSQKSFKVDSCCQQRTQDIIVYNFHQNSSSNS